MKVLVYSIRIWTVEAVHTRGSATTVYSIWGGIRCRLDSQGRGFSWKVGSGFKKLLQP